MKMHKQIGVHIALVSLLFCYHTNTVSGLLQTKYSTIGELVTSHCSYDGGDVKIYWTINGQYIPEHECNECNTWSIMEARNKSKLFITPKGKADFGIYECKVNDKGNTTAFAAFELRRGTVKRQGSRVVKIIVRRKQVKTQSIRYTGNENPRPPRDTGDEKALTVTNFTGNDRDKNTGAVHVKCKLKQQQFSEVDKNDDEKYKPYCDKNGLYESVQTDQQNLWYWCVDKNTGETTSQKAKEIEELPCVKKVGLTTSQGVIALISIETFLILFDVFLYSKFGGGILSKCLPYRSNGDYSLIQDKRHDRESDDDYSRDGHAKRHDADDYLLPEQGNEKLHRNHQKEHHDG